MDAERLYFITAGSAVLYQVRLITYDYRIRAKIRKTSFSLFPVPCGLNDKSLPEHDITDNADYPKSPYSDSCD